MWETGKKRGVTRGGSHSPNKIGGRFQVRQGGRKKKTKKLPKEAKNKTGEKAFGYDSKKKQKQTTKKKAGLGGLVFRPQPR